MFDDMEFLPVLLPFLAAVACLALYFSLVAIRRLELKVQYNEDMMWRLKDVCDGIVKYLRDDLKDGEIDLRTREDSLSGNHRLPKMENPPPPPPKRTTEKSTTAEYIA